ncbi:hypothetical protein [Natronorubrum sp. FCH18a]|uniref:hypothetical protein n=1 Tax=Natronorubrum sp. FCH18a TaxID=3447018 RepID=UPI003F519BA8
MITTDENAFLEIDNQDMVGPVAGNNDEPTTVASLTNNVDQTTQIDVSIVSIDNANDDILAVDTADFELGPSESTSARVQCARAESVGEQEVTFQVETMNAPLTVTGATFTTVVDIDCGTGSGQIEPTDSGLSDVAASDLTQGGTSQTQTFAFTLTEDLSTGDTTTITASSVGNGNRLDYSEASANTDDPGIVTETSGNDYELVFEATDDIARGERVSITVDGVETKKNAAKQSPYDVSFDRNDKEATEETSFSVD